MKVQTQVQYSQKNLIIAKLQTNCEDKKQTAKQLGQSTYDKKKNQTKSQPKGQEISGILSKIITEVENNDFSYLFGEKETIEFIKELRQNRQRIPSFVEKEIRRFLDTINARIEQVSYSQTIYKDLLEETSKLARTYSYYGNKRHTTLSSHQTDQLFKHFIYDLETRPIRQGKYYVEDKEGKKIQLGELMAKTSQFFTCYKWKAITQLTKSIVQQKNLQEARHENTEIAKIKGKLEFSKSIYKKHTINISCLGCTPYFIKNWNIFDQSVNKTRFVLGGTVLNFIKDENESNSALENIRLKRKICGLLNNGGGSILFGCERRYLDVTARGQVLTKQQAQKFIKKINKIVRQIKPSPKLEQNFIISFVPVLRDSISESTKNSLQGLQKFQDWFSGSYVARIVVRPTFQHIYAYEDSQKWIQAFRYRSIFDDQKSISNKEISEKQANSIQSQACKRDQSSQDWVSALLNSAYTDFDHQQCQIPLYGAKIPQKMTNETLIYEYEYENHNGLPPLAS